MNDTKQMGVNPNFVVGVVSNTSGNGVLKMVSPTENFTTTGTYDAAVTALSICVSGGGGGGSLTNTYVGFGSGLNTLVGEPAFNYDAEANRVSVDTVKTKRITAKVSPLEILGDIKELSYTNTRNDAGLPVNILSTSLAGVQESHPISELAEIIDSCNSTRITGFRMGADTINKSPGYADMDGAFTFYNDNGRLIQIGGWKGPSASHNEQWYSDNNGLTWTQAANAAFCERHTFGFVKKGSFFYVIGGDDQNCPSGRDEVWKSATTDGLTWTLVTNTAAFGNRIVSDCAVKGSEIFLFGGQLSGAVPAPLLDVWKSADNGTTWTNVCLSCLPAGHGNTWGTTQFWKGKFWMIGGMDFTFPNTYYKTVYSSPDGITWTAHPDLPISVTGLGYPRTFIMNGQLWVYGGTDGTDQRFLLYTEDGDNWTDQTTTEMRPGHAIALGVKPNGTGVIVTSGFQNDVFDVYQRTTQLSKYVDCNIVESLATDNSKLPAIPLNQIAFGTTTGIASSNKFVVSGNDLNLSVGDLKSRYLKSNYDNAILAGTDVGGTYIGNTNTAATLYLGGANTSIRNLVNNVNRLNIASTGQFTASGYGSGTFTTGLGGYIASFSSGGIMSEIPAADFYNPKPLYEIMFGAGAGVPNTSSANLKTNAFGHIIMGSGSSNAVLDNIGNALCAKDAGGYYYASGYSATTLPIYMGGSNSAINFSAAGANKLILNSTGVRMPTLAAKTAGNTRLQFWNPTTGEVAHAVFGNVGTTPNATAVTINATDIVLEPATASFPGVVTTTTQNFAGTKRITATNPLQLNGLQSGAKTDSIVVVNGGILKAIPSTSLKFPLKMTVVDGNTDVPGAGTQTYEVIRIPACYNGYSISDVSYGVWKTGATGTAEMQIRKNGSGTAGVTWTAGQGVKDVTLTGVTVATGDIIDVEIISNSMATPQQGLWVTIFLTPH